MSPKRLNAELQVFVAIVCALALMPGDTLAHASFSQQAPAPSQTNQASKVSADQLDSLVPPIALYPDPLSAQTLASPTSPLEIIQLHQWLENTKNLKHKALSDAVEK